MTPTELNKRIRAGEIWYWTSTASVAGIVRKAFSQKGKVKIKTDAGNMPVEYVRQSGSNEWVYLRAEGVLTWAIN